MPALIHELQAQHAALKSLLLSFKKTNDRNEHMRILQAAKRGLENHLEKEDAELYPFLRAEAERDPELKRLLELFDEDMRKVTGAVTDFFVRYDGGWDNDYEFLMDLAEITTRLSQRIEFEEKHLYPEYLKRKTDPKATTSPGLLARLRRLFGGKG